ncbi:MAG: cobinamide kinase/cobinamide phosphate guanylyltransferase [Dehalococcoides mccartyi]|uniref:bifunctional adenosylcobinamide kinase/adenosylcobinamide-phosphate guanylyltransferase n=1 Tax=Dehalococcoides mccartyi TaxID=61435 RepID=UPI0024324A5B|nr:bifunctional adenosylcobinamide kinase/adenosylcobinamide-phosphate guanylyltransferase [Dehalococcoides mccartyi]MCF7634917.1 cobinamide kinase/cobinamide phosphate guanylyltransferase [Dehalococcoides mccartyi]MEA2120794.1 Bifunctional adenosylcobalamin biosynthesis protein CobU [Dehalococcoides mccartyi]MEA2121901.1 Bifunctional adenosylcobalamin biosynthesis protein CobU [Dehalococcoides mccartyi]
MNYLLIGGARSGKSSYAEELAKSIGGNIVFVATAEAGDDEMKTRILRHQQARPPEWGLIEASLGVGEKIIARVNNADVIILDCITLLVNNIMCRYMLEHGDELTGDAADYLDAAVKKEINDVIKAMEKTGASFIVVTNDVGAGLIPPNAMARVYRDLLGRANQMLGAYVEYVYLMVAGLPMQVKPLLR